MKVRFIIPEEARNGMKVFAGRQVQPMIFREDSLAGQFDAGAIFHEGRLFTREEFLACHNSFGAVMVAPDRKAVERALGLASGHAGIVQGFTEAEYAKKVGKTRQTIQKAVKTGRLPAVKIGKINIVKYESLEDARMRALEEAQIQDDHENR